MSIGKNAIKRVENNGYSKVKTAAPDMENSSVVEEVKEAAPVVETPAKKPATKKSPAKKACTKKCGKKLCETDANKAVFGTVYDKNGEKIDTGLVTVFKAPRSYTGRCPSRRPEQEKSLQES